LPPRTAYQAILQVLETLEYDEDLSEKHRAAALASKEAMWELPVERFHMELATAISRTPTPTSMQASPKE